jgi:hypothetical protein
MLELGDPNDAEALEVLARLRREHPGLLLIVSYESAGEELATAQRQFAGVGVLARRSSSAPDSRRGTERPPARSSRSAHLPGPQE